MKASTLAGPQLLHEARHFSEVEALITIASILTLLAVLAVYAVIGPRFERESAAGPIGTGIMLAILGVGIVFVLQIPWGILGLWWERRHHIAETGYGEWIALYIDQAWAEALIMSLAVVIVVGFARRVGERWWLLAAPLWVGLLLLDVFIAPYLLEGSSDPLPSARLAADAKTLARREGVEGLPVRVLRIGGPPNAVSVGVGSSRRVFLWDTLVDGGFSDREVDVVIAHEFGHHAHDHLWKLLGLEALFLLPAGFVVARVTRRRGGMGQPAAVPLGLLAFFALQTLATPALNAVSRRFEAEADWAALEATHDPAAQKALFKKFVSGSLNDPSPPAWSYVLFSTHPTDAQRVAMVEAWQQRQRGQATSAQSPRRRPAVALQATSAQSPRRRPAVALQATSAQSP